MFSIVQQSLFPTQSSMWIAVHKAISKGYESAEIASQNLKSILVWVSVVECLDNNRKPSCNISGCYR